MRIFISTGEVSGDLQGSLLIEALERQSALRGIDLEIVGLGGDRMKQAGATLLANTAGIGAVGILESLPFVLTTLRIQRQAKRYLREYLPDVVVLIDYAGPNVDLGRFLKKYLPQIPVIYYIAPQAWVWSPSKQTTQQIIRACDRILAIFPEEARFFAGKGAKVTWLGHPLLDRLATAPTRQEARLEFKIEPDQPCIALFTASRKQEIKALLPLIGEAAQRLQKELPGVHFLFPLSLEVYRSEIVKAIETYHLQATIVTGKSLEAIAAADLAITKSGTVNLEIALMNVPQVIVYRVRPSTIWFARRILNFSIPFMAPPNLVLMREIVPELLQEQATPERVVEESLALLLNPQRREKVFKDYQEMRTCLGEIGVCDRAAQEILQSVDKTR